MLARANLDGLGCYPQATCDFFQNIAVNLIKGSPAPPKTPPTPAAPQTASEMVNWTPADLDAADRSAYEAWAKNPYPDAPHDNEVAMWLTVAVAAVAALLAVKVAAKVLL